MNKTLGHVNCSVESVVERGAAVLPLSSVHTPPTRTPKKNHPQPTQNVPPSNFLINSVMTQGQIPWSVPIHESSVADPCKRIHTQNSTGPTPATTQSGRCGRTELGGVAATEKWGGEGSGRSISMVYLSVSEATDGV